MKQWYALYVSLYSYKKNNTYHNCFIDNICYCLYFSDRVRQKHDPTPDVHIMYEDQPYCDFKSLFLMANGGLIQFSISLTYLAVSFVCSYVVIVQAVYN